MTTRNDKFKYRAYYKHDKNKIRTNIEYGIAYSMEVIGLIITGYSFMHKAKSLISISQMKSGENKNG